MSLVVRWSVERMTSAWSGLVWAKYKRLTHTSPRKLFRKARRLLQPREAKNLAGPSTECFGSHPEAFASGLAGRAALRNGRRKTGAGCLPTAYLKISGIK